MNKVFVMIITQNYHSAWSIEELLTKLGWIRILQILPGEGLMLLQDKDGDLTGQVLEDPAIMLLLAAAL